MATNLIRQAEREVKRVFTLAEVEADTTDGELVLVRVKGWPDRVCYRTRQLIECLGKFADGHGETEEGDREVCGALEEAGAFLSFA